MAVPVLFFYTFLLVRFPDIELNPGPRQIPAKCRLMFSNINGLFGNIRDLAVTSSRYDMIICAETKVTSHRNVAELRLPRFAKPVQILRGARPNGLGMALYVREGFAVTRLTQYECKCCEMMVTKIYGSRINFYIFCVYRSPNTDDRVYDCLLASMGAIQSVDRKAVFCFIGDFNAHHKDWLGSRITDSHGRNAHEFALNSDSSQLVTGPTHRLGGTLDLFMTNVPDLCRVVVSGSIGDSDHSSISTTISTNQRVPNFCVSKTVYQKSRIPWDALREDVSDLPWPLILSSEQPITLFNQLISTIVDRRIPKIVIKIRNNDEPWFDRECRLAFDRKQTAYLNWNRTRTREDWQVFVGLQRDANECYHRAQREFNLRCRNKLNENSNPHKWWQNLKNAVFGANSSIPPLVKQGGGLASHPREKSELLSQLFDSKQSRDEVVLPSTCHIAPVFTGIAFRSSEVKKLLTNLDPHGGVDHLGQFPLLFKQCANIIAPKLSALFRILVRKGSFPIEWRNANITPIPKGPLSSNPSDYRPISITPVLSKVFEKLIACRLSKYLETSGLISSQQFAYRKGLGTCDALLTVNEICQKALDAGHEVRLIAIDFSAAFDRVNHAGIIFKLQEVGIGGTMLDILREYLTNRSQTVVIDGQPSRRVEVVSGVPQGSVLGPLMFNIYTGELATLFENTFIAYADDSNLVAIIRSPKHRVEVALSLIRDLVKLHAWCVAWGMLLNLLKTKTMLISRSRAEHPAHPDISINNTILENVSELKILGLTLDSKLTYEKHVQTAVAAAAQKLGILRLAWSIYHDESVVSRCFWGLILPILEYCSPVWGSAADGHLALLDRIVNRVRRMSSGLVQCNLLHRRNVAALCMLHKIRANAAHPLNTMLPQPYVPPRVLRRHAHQHAHRLSPVIYRT